MNRDNRKLLSIIVAQRMEMGDREWYFNPLHLLQKGDEVRPRIGKGSEVDEVSGKKTESAVSDISEDPVRAVYSGDGSLDELNAAVRDCHRCILGEKRTSFVFGHGNPDADVMFVGEAPGAEEDIQGLPFVGRAGQLLTKMIESINLRREDVYITNVLKCRPPGNRDPQSAEIAECEPVLLRQIEIIKPKIICALGRISGQTLLRTTATLGALRGKVHDYHGVKLVVTYHPAALLRNPNWKRPAWEDLKFLRREYDGVEI